MRIMLGICGILAAGVFVTMFLSIWNSRRSSNGVGRFHQTAVAEVVWAAIPCLMVIAAAIPAAIVIIAPAPTVRVQAAADHGLEPPLTPTQPCAQVSESPECDRASSIDRRSRAQL
jgi:heme/copper-type cytochrome/quinol oxidase subunit 2